nr:uncharacterized protein LOC128690586 [Cherax quadricarinatus]
MNNEAGIVDELTLLETETSVAESDTTTSGTMTSDMTNDAVISSTTNESVATTIASETDISSTTDDSIATSVAGGTNTSSMTESSVSSTSDKSVLPWWDRVKHHLTSIDEVTGEIMSGAVDTEHAYHLDQEATALDALVKEGNDDHSQVLHLTNEDLDFIHTVNDNVKNVTKYIDDQVTIAKADETELIVSLTCLSVLFVVVLVSLVVSLVRPASPSCGLPKTRYQTKSGEQGESMAEPQDFPNALYVQHSQLYSDPYRNQTTVV